MAHSAHINPLRLPASWLLLTVIRHYSHTSHSSPILTPSQSHHQLHILQCRATTTTSKVSLRAATGILSSLPRYVAIYIIAYVSPSVANPIKAVRQEPPSVPRQCPPQHSRCGLDWFSNSYQLNLLCRLPRRPSAGVDAAQCHHHFLTWIPLFIPIHLFISLKTVPSLLLAPLAFTRLLFRTNDNDMHYG